MNTDKKRLEYLLSHGDWSAEDEQWMAEQLLLDENEEYRRLVLQFFNSDLKEGNKIDENISRRVKERIRQRLNLDEPATAAPVYKMQWVKRIGRWPAAAAVLIIVTGIYFFIEQRSGKHITKTSSSSSPGTKLPNDVAPGGNKAILTLSNGLQIILDSASNGTLAQQGNNKVVKLGDGQLLYTNIEGASSDKIVYNTMRTPRGGQYRLTLPDGTGVWLNAESSITYPVSFAGSERNVSITGEAYFEVTKKTDARTHHSAPFTVKVNEMTVEVLGTHFNINSYKDESNIKTTLLEGRVGIKLGQQSSTLKPGEQFQVNQQGLVKIVKNADLEETMAWKNGLFYFSNADIQTVMRQLMRWYDVDVSYEGKIPVREFQGEIQKDLNLSQVLKILGRMEVRFKLEGKKLIVLP